jgi:hypothetical protein
VGELKGKMEKFCQYYTGEANGNAAMAARMAGYSEKTARTIGHENLTKPDIQARIRELRLEAVRASGYEPERVRALIAERMLAIVSANLTDVVHISPGTDDPDRAAALDALAAMNGGQRVIDFGDMIVVPTLRAPEITKAALKKIKMEHDQKGHYRGLDIELHDPVAAARTLAQILGIGADSAVNVNVDIGEMLDAARKRLKDGNTPAPEPPEAEPPAPEPRAAASEPRGANHGGSALEAWAG